MTLSSGALYNIGDVALYVVECMAGNDGKISSMKLQKLCYYIQSWFYVKNRKPFFPHDYQAWRMGPVSPTLYKFHKGLIDVSVRDLAQNDSSKICDADKKFIDKVLNVYGRYTGLQLSNMTHSQDPWIEARKGFSPNDPSQEIISLKSIYNYYSKY